MCLPQRSWPYNRDMPIFPYWSKAHKSRAFEAIPPDQIWGGRPTHNPGAPRAPVAPKAVINYINGGPSDEEYDSRRKGKNCCGCINTRTHNSIRPGLTGEGPRPIDGTIIFPPGSHPDTTTTSRRPHLVPGNWGLRCLENPGRILSGFNGSSTTSLGDIILPVQAGPVTLNTRPAEIRRFHPDRQKVIRNEIDKLLEAGFIREVSYPDWLANVVCFPLPRIDQIVDSTSGQGMLSFLDAFSGYHQIPMSPDDEEKTAFITPHGLYCYKVMPFGLKNAGATYQRLMTKIFKPLIGHSVEIYGQPKGHRSQPGSSQGSYGNTSSQEQEGDTTSHRQARCVRTFIARFTDELRPFFLAIRKTGAHGWTDSCQSALKGLSIVLCNHPS
ncbi:Transposon Ty3-I Gag-Pol polyprotein [Vitis vinifera]|uniref:Transposon Ty3-I Gag-Pol polyprotein n=1 Tax=Vitis vinifera TaxID=29760 RepID=A0A438I3F9_VITVI|nr:Transposon Ty3-I Gag-Pol polyprotein [Vitis vinifera]